MSYATERTGTRTLRLQITFWGEAVPCASRFRAKFGPGIRGYLPEVACACLGMSSQRGARHGQCIWRNNDGRISDPWHRMSCQGEVSPRWYGSMEVSGDC